MILRLSFGRILRETASTGGPYAFIGFQQSKEAQGAVQSSIYRHNAISQRAMG